MASPAPTNSTAPSLYDTSDSLNCGAFNRAVSQLLNIKPEDALGKRYADILKSKDAEIGRLIEIIKRAISQKVDRINLLSHPSLFRVRWGSHTETRLYAAYVMRGHPHALAAMAQEKLGQLTGRIEY